MRRRGRVPFRFILHLCAEVRGSSGRGAPTLTSRIVMLLPASGAELSEEERYWPPQS